VQSTLLSAWIALLESFVSMVPLLLMQEVIAQQDGIAEVEE